MQQHIYYIKFALRFADMQIPELVNEFNSQIQNRGWSSMRAYHNQALVDEFDCRGIDNTTIRNGGSISFAHPVRYFKVYYTSDSISSGVFAFLASSNLAFMVGFL